MPQSAWESFKQKLAVVGAILLGLLGILFVVEKDKREEVEEKLLNKDSEEKDKELKQEQTVVEQDVKKTETDAEKAKEAPITEQQALEVLDKL